MPTNVWTTSLTCGSSTSSNCRIRSVRPDLFLSVFLSDLRDGYGVTEIALQRVASQHRSAVIEILKQPKSSQSQKRSMLLRRGIPRNIVDELELLAETRESPDTDLMNACWTDFWSTYRREHRITDRTIREAVAASLGAPSKVSRRVEGNGPVRVHFLALQSPSALAHFCSRAR